MAASNTSNALTRRNKRVLQEDHTDDDESTSTSPGRPSHRLGFECCDLRYQCANSTATTLPAAIKSACSLFLVLAAACSMLRFITPPTAGDWTMTPYREDDSPMIITKKTDHHSPHSQPEHMLESVNTTPPSKHGSLALPSRVRVVKKTAMKSSPPPCREILYEAKSGVRGPVPTPVILISRGRSGSSVTWDLLGRLTGRATPSHELTGQDPKESWRFFTHLVKEIDGEEGTEGGHIPGQWVREHLCRKQRLYPNAGIVGFKWKPHQSIMSQSARAGLEVIAKSHDPAIKVIRLRRNLLDVVISMNKHRRVWRERPPGSGLQSQCPMGDNKCVREHANAAMGLTLNMSALVKELRNLTVLEDEVDQLLEVLGVPHLHVSYERLYGSPNVREEWMRIFRFLGRGPSKDLTASDVRKEMKFAPTSNLNYSATLENYDEFVSTLQTTEFASMLH